MCCRMGETSKYLFEQVLEEAHFGGYGLFRDSRSLRLIH